MKSIHVNLSTTSYKPNGRVEKTFDTRVYLSKETTFQSLIDFQKEAKKLFNQAVKAVKSGTYMRFEINVLTYKDSHSLILEKIDSWYTNSQDCLGTDDNNKEFIYLSPDTKYTKESWDMCIYPDIIKSLAEAGI